MKKIGFWIIIAIIILAVIAGIIFYSTKNQTDSGSSSSQTETSDTRTIQTTEGADTVLFYGYSCPHCKLVEEYIIKNDIDTKVQFDMKEVYKNTKNASDLEAAAAICNIPTSELGVPFLYDGATKTCLTGETEIKDFLNQKVKNQN